MEHRAEAGIAIWKESLCGVDFFLLHATPAYYGLGIPRGDGSAVVLIPGFLSNDTFLEHMYSWLERIGYCPYRSGIALNADCPDLLIRQQLMTIVDKALKETRRKVHLIGHSLGGVIAHSIAVQRPLDVASVITLGSPLRGTVVHPEIWYAAEQVRKQILQQRGPAVLSNCYTPRCNCDFSKSLRRRTPRSVAATAIYTRHDGVVDWRYCATGDSRVDFEVPGTHIGLPFNATAYTIIAMRLAEAQSGRSGRSAVRTRKRPVRNSRQGASVRPLQNLRPKPPSSVMPAPNLTAEPPPAEIMPRDANHLIEITPAPNSTPAWRPAASRTNGGFVPAGRWNRFRRNWATLVRKSKRAISAARLTAKQKTQAAAQHLAIFVRKMRGRE